MDISNAYTLDSSVVNLGTAGAETATGRQLNNTAARQPDNATYLSNSTPATSVNFSPESRARQSQFANKSKSATTRPDNAGKGAAPATAKDPIDNKEENKNSINELSEDEKRQVNELKKRDTEVKAHEQAHIAAGGAYVSGGASYEYEQGPDHKNYAVGGEVSIDTSAENTPEATIRKMQIVKRAALAPMKPSGQDRSVAAQAAQAEARARIELRQQRSEEAEEKKNKNNNIDNTSSTGSQLQTGNPDQASANSNDTAATATPGHNDNRQIGKSNISQRQTRNARNAYQTVATTINPFNAQTNNPAFNAFA